MTEDSIDNLREVQREDPLSRTWVRRALTAVGVFALAMVVVAVGVLVWRLSVVTSYATAQDAAAAEAQAAYQELFEACSLADDCDPSGLPTPEEVEQASPTPEDVAAPIPPLAPQPTTITVEEQLTVAEIEAIGDEALERYCAQPGDPCVGPGGAPAPPTDPAVIAGAVVAYCGTGACSPTFDVVFAAVAAICANGACVGQQGEPGVAGPPPSTEAVLAAVASVCADGACVGPAGAQGVQGASVVGSVCEGTPSTIRFLIYDPATGATAVSDSGAACTPAVVVPDPAPSPEPPPTEEPGIDIPVPSLDP